MRHVFQYRVQSWLIFFREFSKTLLNSMIQHLPNDHHPMDFDFQVYLRRIFLESNRLLSERHLSLSARWSSEALNGMLSLTSEQQYAEYQLIKRQDQRLFNPINPSLSSSAMLEPATANVSTNGPGTGMGINTGSSSFIGTNTNMGAKGGLSPAIGNSLSGTLSILHTSDYKMSSSSDSEDFQQFVERDKTSLASSYFDCKEFKRCHHILKECKSYKAVFIRLYALYLSGEKKKNFENGSVLGQNDTNAPNPYLPVIVKELEEFKNHKKISQLTDPFLLYLQGIIYLKTKKFSHAQEAFYQSVSLYPVNWSCWKEMISSLSTFSEAARMINRLQKNTTFVDKKEYSLMFAFFKITVYQEFFQFSEEIRENLDELTVIFPNFSYLKTQKALLSYNELDYNTAEEIFDDILKTDPMRLDEMDIYSNILYVMENKSKLSHLAHYASEVDPLRPETCCIIANYYSIKFDHKKAIMYYKRALSLSQDCLSAWTLMGHEFVELKNSNAAIESYRRAIDTNNKDFRAWYGLGQAYEVLDMHLYSLYYYERACALKPLDKRMWQAIGNCCEKLDNFEDAIKAYKKASSVSDSDPTIFYKLGTLYDQMQEQKNAKDFMKLCLEEEINSGDITDETIKARLWLAKHERANKNWHLAYNYAIELTHGTSQEIEEARTIARESRMNLNMNSGTKKRFL